MPEDPIIHFSFGTKLDKNMEQGQVFPHDSELRLEIGAIDIQIK